MIQISSSQYVVKSQGKGSLLTFLQVLKRVMQLTGSRIPDPEIDGIKSANGILGHLIKKPKPKKLAETLKLSDKLKILPNLQIMDRRYTPIDKEKELGRWKVAVKELRARGLPVTGHA